MLIVPNGIITSILRDIDLMDNSKTALLKFAVEIIHRFIRIR